jgi:hypothetical protein
MIGSLRAPQFTISNKLLATKGGVALAVRWCAIERLDCISHAVADTKGSGT